MIKNTTQVPNTFFDQYLPNLTGAEIKLILVIIRQTLGWVDYSTGKRKRRDRITQSQFRVKSGLTPRIISKTLKMLSDKEFIVITDRSNTCLKNAIERKGKPFLYYSLNPMHFLTSTNAQSDTRPVHKVIYNKRNYTKENYTKERQTLFSNTNGITIGEVIQKSNYSKRFGY